MRASKNAILATAGRDRVIRVWDAATRGLLCRGRLHAAAVSTAWSPDGEHIAVGTTNGDCAILAVGDDGGARNGLSSVRTSLLEERMSDQTKTLVAGES